MLRFVDGFDQFVGQSGETLAASLETAGYKVTGDVSIVEGRRELTKCLRVDGSISRNFNSTARKVVIGFAYKSDEGRSPILKIENGITLDWEAEISIGGSKGEAIPILGMWWYYEVVIDKSEGMIVVRINDGDDLEVAMPSSMEFMVDFKVTWESDGVSGPKFIDDIYFLDGSGGKYKEALGPISAGIRAPTADVNTQFSPSEGVDNFRLVSALPPDDEKYVQSNESGHVDTYRSSVGLPEGDIIAMGVIARMRKSDIDGRFAATIIGDIDGDFKAVTHPRLDIVNEYKYSVFEVGPDGEDWTEYSAFDVPFGVQVKP